MSNQEVDVEAVVRAVMARLAGSNRPARVAVGKSRELTLLGRLVTEDDLIRQLSDEKVLKVAAGTVLTPSARDHLRARGVAVQRSGTNKPTAAKSAAFRLAIGLAESKFEPSGIVTQLKRDGIEVEQLARVGLTGAVDELSDRVAKGGDRGVLFTARPTAAACLANRNRGVRAATVRDADEVREIMKEVNANLLVMNPAIRATHQVLRAIRTWYTTTATALTPELQQRLG